MKGTFHFDQELEITFTDQHMLVGYMFKGQAAVAVDFDIPTAVLREDRIAPTDVSVTRCVLRQPATFHHIVIEDCSVTFSPRFDLTPMIDQDVWRDWAEAIAAHFTETEIPERF